MIIKLKQIAETLFERVEKHQAAGKTSTLKVKFTDYLQITRSRTLDKSINDLDTIAVRTIELFKSLFK